MTVAGAWPPDLTPASLASVDHDGPFLAIDCGIVAERIRRLVEAVPGLQIFYAMKCNSDPAVLEAVRGTGAGFEIASAFELDLVLRNGARAEDVLYSNPVKPAGHIATALARGVDRFAFDSEGELRKIAAVAPGARVYARMAVPDRDSLFPLSRKFGAPPEQCARLLALARHLGLEPYGITFHVGSQCTAPAAWRLALERCGHAMRLLLELGIKLEMVDLGGGLPAPYRDPVPSLDDVATAIADGLGTLPYRPRLLCAEPGRYVVAEAGVLAANVIGVEEREDGPWAFLDVGGYNGLMEALQTGGRWHLPMATSRADDAYAPRRLFTVTGPSCDSSDTVFLDAPLPVDLATGDRLYLGSAGAYTLSYASHFNGFPPPTTVVVRSGATVPR